MRIDFHSGRHSSNALFGPQPAASDPGPVDRAELEGAARKLEEQGCTFQVFKGAFFGIGPRDWRTVERKDGLETLDEDGRIQVTTPDGSVLQVASRQDLLELSAFRQKSTDRLPSAVLAAALSRLEQVGRLSTYQTDSYDRRTCTSYEAYNFLTRDPNHEGLREVRFEHGGQSMVLDSPEKAQVAAYLAAGFGDPASLPARAVNLSSLAKAGLLPRTALEQFQSYDSLRLQQGGATLLELAPHQLDQPDVMKQVEEARGQYAEVEKRLAADLRNRAWSTMWGNRQKVPVAEQADFLRALAALKEKADVLPLYQQLIGELKPGDKLDAALPLAREVIGAVNEGGVMAEVYKTVKSKPEQKEVALGLMTSTQDWRWTSELAPRLAGEQVPAVLESLEALKQAGHSLPQAAGLVREAVLKQRLEADRPRLLRLGKPSEASANYRLLVEKVPEGAEEAFLGVCETGLSNRQVAAAWEALARVPEQIGPRTGAWKAMRATLGEQKAGLADSILQAATAETDLAWTQRALADMLAAPGARAEATVETLKKLMASKDPELTAALVAGGGSLNEATELARAMSRKGFPGCKLKPEVRGQAVGALGRANGGDLKRGLDDYLFLMSQLDDPEQIAGASGFLVELRNLGLPDREARLAFTDLSTRSVSDEHGTLFMDTLKLTGSYASARPVWDAMSQLPAPDAHTRMAPLQSRQTLLKGSLPGDQLGRLGAAQLAAPLSENGWESLEVLLRERSPLQWSAHPAWRYRPEEGWRLSRPRNPAEQTPPGGSYHTLTSEPCDLPASGETILRVESRGNCGRNDGPAVEVVGEDGRVTNLGGIYAQQQDWQWNTLSLKAFQGKRVRLRIRSSSSQVSEGVSASIRRMRLSSVGAQPVTTASAGRVEVPSGRTEAVDNLREVTLPDQPCSLHFFEEHRQGSAQNSLLLEIGENKVFKPLASFSGAGRGEHRVDLSPYRGKTVLLRFVAREPQADPAEKAVLSRSPGVIRLDSQAWDLDLGGHPGVDPETFQGLLGLAFDATQPEAVRKANLEALGALSRQGTHLTEAWKAWPCLAGHLQDADVLDRAAALGVLIDSQPADRLAELGAFLAGIRRGDERMEDLARLLRGRSREDFLRVRERVTQECGVQATPGQAVRFLADFQEATDPARAEEAWQVVSRPVRDETMQERIQAYSGLIEAVEGKVDQARKLWDQVNAQLDPNDDVVGAAQAAAQLMVAFKRDQKRVFEALDKLHGMQREGPLMGRPLELMARTLVTRSLLASQSLEEALKRLPQDMPANPGVSEEERHVIVGGVTVKRREGEEEE